MKPSSRAWLTPSLLLLVACTTQPPAPVRERQLGAEREAPSQAATPIAPIVVPPLSDSGHKPGPLPIMPLNVHARCAFEDEGGTQATMALDVRDADVKRFNAEVAILHRGTCSFALKDFRQTGKLPISRAERDLPFAVASSDGLPPADRVAWLRALKVDERATIIASAPDSGLALGDKLVGIGGDRIGSGPRMIAALAERRDVGRPFDVRTAAGRNVRVTPVAMCRGRAQIAEPAKPDTQDYHWTHSVHPHEVFRVDLTADEALWLVLWTQGLAAEGGARMMAYQYGVAPLRVLLNVAAFIGGAGAVAKAAQGVSPAAAGEAGAVVMKNVASGVAVNIAKQQAETAMSESSRNRASLEGVAWVAGTVFDQADRWSFERMTELGADPLAAFSLHRKLVAAGSADNAFVLDAQRLPALLALAESREMGAPARAALEGPATRPSVAAVQTESDPISRWVAEPMPQAEEVSLAAVDDFDRQMIESVSAMPMETLR